MIDAAGGSEPQGLGAMPGSEHLSSLREAYLRLLAAENGFAFQRLRAVPQFAAALQDPAMARPVEVRADARPALAAVAFLLLLAPYARGCWSQLNSLRRGMSAPRREHVMAAARAAKVSAADH
jgi:mxaL protein